jgi:hypothetical protein
LTQKLAALAVAGLVILAAPATRADFTITDSAPPATAIAPAVPGLVRPGPGVVSDTPRLDRDDRKPPTAVPARRSGITPPSVVQGFGDQIPLAFACRQILPSSVKVTYGPGADPGMIVTWKGGGTWPQVLAAAIKPLGLHMLRSGNAVRLES